MRAWFLTNTRYGTWLPGDRRGSITSVRDQRPTDLPSEVRFEHDMPGEPWEDAMPGLFRAAAEQLKCPPIYFEKLHAELVLEQFLETAQHRGWTIHVVAIMCNHFHIVVEGRRR